MKSVEIERLGALFGGKCDEVATLSKVLLDRDTEIAILKSNLEVARSEIESLAGVIERDRRRVEAETAGYARQVAGDRR